jgi:hypothetical protein
MDKPTKQLIVKLISMDIVNHKLVSSLSDMQINAEEYVLGIDEIIFEMIGLNNSPEEESIFEQYLSKSAKVKQMNLKTQQQEIQLLAEDIFDFLWNRKLLLNA